ncbi:glycosyltransferase family 4 protein [Granulicella paludicola]|uniref:glycosyltransferase family 4 protein n=1 Tax=Granulicella paludicola TaxID=474951 RepID=UPI0021E00FA5|nr:glycosyltransferase family 4 protein [Granulicella paludicola]
MKITQAVFGVFHHFALAREMERRGHLQKIYSTWPWARLKREGIVREKVETFPWLHTPETILNRTGLLPRRLSDDLGVQNALRFDDWTYRRIPEDTDALIAIAGAALKTGQIVQQRGGQFICDRGSTHQRYQEQLVSDEYRRWGVNLPVSDIRDTLREEEIYAVADAVTVPSSFALQSYLEMGVPRGKLHVIPYGAELRELRMPADAPQRSSKNGFHIVFAGAVSLRKGVPYLLQAFAQLKVPGKKLRLAGYIDPDIKQVLGRLPTDDVEILGPLPRPQLIALMHASDVLVLPSIEDGFGLVMAEAMACGCAIISSTNTGGSDLYTDGVEGYIVPIRDPKALADRLQQLVENRDLLARMRRAAKAKVAQIGGWSDYGDRWASLLQELTGKG